jgi:hypothetical protein
VTSRPPVRRRNEAWLSPSRCERLSGVVICSLV